MVKDICSPTFTDAAVGSTCRRGLSVTDCDASAEPGSTDVEMGAFPSVNEESLGNAADSKELVKSAGKSWVFRRDTAGVGCENIGLVVY